MSIAAEIISGDHDNELQTISDAVRARRKLVKSSNAALAMTEIQVGDRVVLKNLRPKYINGSRATVTKKNRTRFVINLDEPIQRFGQHGITVPANCVEKV